MAVWAKILKACEALQLSDTRRLASNVGTSGADRRGGAGGPTRNSDDVDAGAADGRVSQTRGQLDIRP